VGHYTYGSLALAALEYRARQGEIILLYGDDTVGWRLALPRAGWWRKALRARLPTRPLRPSQITRDASRKRPAWGRYRSWSRIPSGVLLSVIGAVQYGTSKVFYKVVPHFEQNLGNLRRNHFAPIRSASLSVTDGMPLSHPPGAKQCAPSKATFAMMP
jgi:hypothetical protein